MKLNFSPISRSHLKDSKYNVKNKNKLPNHIIMMLNVKSIKISTCKIFFLEHKNGTYNLANVLGLGISKIGSIFLNELIFINYNFLFAINIHYCI